MSSLICSTITYCRWTNPSSLSPYRSRRVVTSSSPVDVIGLVFLLVMVEWFFSPSSLSSGASFPVVSFLLLRCCQRVISPSLPRRRCRVVHSSSCVVVVGLFLPPPPPPRHPRCGQIVFPPPLSSLSGWVALIRLSPRAFVAYVVFSKSVCPNQLILEERE